MIIRELELIESDNMLKFLSDLGRVISKKERAGFNVSYQYSHSITGHYTSYSALVLATKKEELPST